MIAMIAEVTGKYGLDMVDKAAAVDIPAGIRTTYERERACAEAIADKRIKASMAIDAGADGAIDDAMAAEAAVTRYLEEHRIDPEEYGEIWPYMIRRMAMEGPAEDAAEDAVEAGDDNTGDNIPGDNQAAADAADGPAGPINQTPASNPPAVNTAGITGIPCPRADINDYFDDAIEAYWDKWNTPQKLTIYDIEQGGHRIREIKKDLLRDVKDALLTDNYYRPKGDSIKLPQALTAYAATQIILRTGDIAVTQPIAEGARELMFYRHTGRDAGIWQPDRSTEHNRISKIGSVLGLSSSDIKDLPRRLKAESRVIKETEDRRYYPAENGVVDLETKEITPYTLADGKENPEYVRKYGNMCFFGKFRTAYNPDAEDPTLTGPDGYVWSVERHFKQALGDNAIAIKAMWEFYNFAVRGVYGGRIVLLVDSTDQAAGGGAKSTTLDMVAEVVGRENVFYRDLDKASARFGLAGIIGKKLMIGHENNSATAIDDASIIKQLARQEEIPVEHKNKDILNYIFRGSIANAMQRAITAREKSSAFYRKFLIIPFPAWLTAKADRQYIQDDFIKRAEVREYILKKALDMGDLKQFSADVVEGLQKYTREARISTSPIFEYCEEVMPTLSNPEVPLDAVYTAYLNFCRDKGYRNPGNLQTFKRDFSSWAVDTGEYRIESIPRDQPARNFGRGAVPEQFLAVYGAGKWRADGDDSRQDMDIQTGGAWNPKRLNCKIRAWVVRVNKTQNNKPRNGYKTPTEIEADYRSFVGAWYYVHAAELADGRLNERNLPDFEQWESMGYPQPRYLACSTRYARAGFQVADWTSDLDGSTHPIGTIRSEDDPDIIA